MAVTGAGSAVQALTIAALRDDAALKGVLNGVFAGPAVRASPPYAEVGETLSADWGTKDRRGREVRLAVLVRDAAETPVRIGDLAATVEDVVLAIPRDIDGWRIASLVFVRSRIAGEAPGRWLAAIEFRARMLAAS